MIKVFDSAGRFVGRVGRQGTGPGEYSTPMPIYTDREGRIHVVDAGIPRETIVDPDFQVYATNRLAVSPWAIVPLGDEGTYVGNLPIQSVSSLGHPLHIIRGAEIVGSFGAPQTGIFDPFNLRRAITVDHSQRIYSAPLDALTIDVWDDAGRQIATFQGGPIRDGDPDDEPGILYTPSSTVSRIHIDRSEKLWILISEPRADWRDHMDIIPLPDGRKRFQPKDHDSSKIYSTRMVVLDLSTGEIVADIQREERFVAFVGDRSLVELRQLEDGTPQLAVWSIEVNLNS
jgi:hypothetical protein